jgi:hypothetical protein
VSLQYLFDENVDGALVAAMRQRDEALIIWAIGDPGAPKHGTLDPDILIWCEEHDFVLVTNNRRSMPLHLADHLRGGRHMPGIFQINPGMARGETVTLLLLAAYATRSDEHHDQIRYLLAL